jgi:hypothetical protein
MYFPLSLLLLLISTQLLGVEVYQCSDDKGKTVFSQFPCGNNAALIQVEPPPATTSTQESIELRNEYTKALEDRSKRLKLRSKEIRLKNLEGNRNALDEKRNKKIATLQKSLRDTFHSRQKAEIKSKIREVRRQYWSDRRRLNDKINDARMDLMSCCN